MNDIANKNVSNSEQQELFFGVDNEINVGDDQDWYQDNLDIVIPVMIIAMGLIQYVLRKWILPVSEDVTSKLEDQFPTQGLIYQPELGAVIIIFGIILLLIFNFQTFI